MYNLTEPQAGSYEDTWTAYGFSRNPFDYRPLRVAAEDRDLFVGRRKEQEQFKVQAAGPEGGIIIVEGPIGVGKTSFVNAMLYDKWNPRQTNSESGPRRRTHSYLPSFETIQLRENQDLASLMLSVLSNCIFSLERIHGQDASESDNYLKAGKELISNTVRSGFAGFSLSILGTGGGVQADKTAVTPAAIPLPTIMNTIDRWFEAAAKRFDYEAVMVPINNLDVLEEQTVVSFLNSARDTLLSRRRVWWILVGGPGLFLTLERNARRVSELITGRPIALGPLSLEDVLEAVRTRVEKFRVTKDAKQPISDAIVKTLYEASGGEVRYTFKRLTDMIYEFRTNFPSENVIPERTAMNSIRILATRNLDGMTLTEREQEVLKLMAAEKSFRIRDYSKFKYDKPQPLQNLVSKFVRLGLLRRVEKSTREVYYSTAGDVNLVFGL